MSSPRSDSRERALVVALLGLHAVLAWTLRMPGVIVGEDRARYLLLGEQLRHFSYHNQYLVGQPPHTLYPPGYPALLALWGILGTSFDWAVVFSIISSLAALVFVFAAVRERWGTSFALPVLGVLVVNPVVVERAGAVASEAPFLALSMATLWAAGRPARRAQWWALGAGIWTGLVRAAGATMLPALAITWFRARQYRPLVTLIIVGALTVGAWQAFSIGHGSSYVGRSYAADFQFTGAGKAGRESSLPARLARRLERSVVFYGTRALPESLSLGTLPGTRLDNLVGTLVLAAGVLVGLVILARKWFVAAAYVACYGTLIAVWPWHVPRFTVPVIPLLAVMLLLGWHRIALSLVPRSAPWMLAALTAALIATGTATTAVQLGRASTCVRGGSPPDPSCVAPEQASFLAAVSAMRNTLPRDAVVLSGRPAAVFYYAGARGVEPPLAALPDSAGFLPFLERQGISHILLTSVRRHDIDKLAPVLEAYCSHLRLQTSVPPFTYLFTFDAAADNQDACRAVRLYRLANRNQRFEFLW